MKSFKNVSLEIKPDADPLNPRVDFDNLGKMICFHSRYDLGDTHEFSTPEEFLEWWIENGAGGILLPLFLYDHSGLTMRTSTFSDTWDSCQVGFIYMSSARVAKEFGGDKQKATRCLHAEVREYDQYLTGDVYGFVVKSSDGETLDSCWGFFGEDEALSAGEESAQYHDEEISKCADMVSLAFAL